jgi:hypothetical protein
MLRATITTATTTDTTRPYSSFRAGGGPISSAGIVRIGSISRMPVVSRPIAVMADATAAAGWPDWISSLAWTTPAVAGPPGTIFPAALPAR